MSVLLDAGPVLNFLAVGQQDALLQVATTAQLRLSTPEQVDVEIRRQATQARFVKTAAGATWTKLKAGKHVTVLPDDLDGPVGHEAGAPARRQGRSACRR